jgi:hypothetical protein
MAFLASKIGWSNRVAKAAAMPATGNVEPPITFGGRRMQVGSEKFLATYFGEYEMTHKEDPHTFQQQLDVEVSEIVLG